jgi:hypothetical protein
MIDQEKAQRRLLELEGTIKSAKSQKDMLVGSMSTIEKQLLELTKLDSVDQIPGFIAKCEEKLEAQQQLFNEQYTKLEEML